MKILITDEQKRIRLNIRKIEALAKKILRISGLASESLLSISFLDRAGIKRLNRQYFRRVRATDVIAFGYRERPGPILVQKGPGRKRDKRITGKRAIFSADRRDIYGDYLGDIVICPGVVLENSRRYQSKFFDELALCIIHGLLHLLGHSDTTKAERLKMQKKEEEILNKLRP